MTPRELKNSILQCAFQGKLVQQCSEEGTGEELLKLLLSEKQKQMKAGKIKKEKTRSEILEDDCRFDIPESWTWCYLGDVFQHNTGKALNSTNRDGTMLQYITTSNLYWNKFELEQLKEMPFTDAEIEKCTVTKGDLLVCEGGDCGRAAIWTYETPMRIQNHIHRLRPFANVCVEYFYYIFNLYKGAGWIAGKGIGIQGLSSNALHAIIAPLPPVAEQKRIVAKLEEILPLIDRYEAAWNKLEEFNKRFPGDMQKSILQLAVQGKLVEQRPEEGTGEELFQQIQAEKQALIKAGKVKKEKPFHEVADEEIPFDIPETWRWVRLQNICSLIGDIDHNMPKSVDPKDGVLFLSAKDLLDDGTINYTNNVKYISYKDFERLSRKALPRRNDIIYSRIGAALGKARVVETDVTFLVSYSCCTIRPLLVDVKYLRYYLESPLILAHSIKARQSIGVPDLGMGEIKKYLVALPPLEEQKRIVAKLEEILPLCDRLK